MILRLVIVGVLFCMSKVEAQCPKCDRDTGTLPTIDLIREFHLSEFEEKYESVPGSIVTQQAYRLYQESNLTVHSYQAFPIGIPYHFWFEATFRAFQRPLQPWYLFHVTNSHGVSQISITLDTNEQLIGIGLPDIRGNVQRVFFRHSDLFDRNWHKLLVSVVKDKVSLWVDCEQTFGVRGDIVEHLLPRKKFDVNGGTAYISQYVDETNHYQNTVQIDLQWMVLGCESTRPPVPNCEELPQYHESIRKPDSPLVQQPTEVPIVQQECPIQCPQGPAGRDGRDGQSIIGEKGERGETGFPGESVIGQKGDKGEPGYIITRTEGETHSFGELEIREICSNVLQEQLAALKPSLIGPVGPPGPPGKAVRSRPGPKGDRGDIGFPGLQGEKGERGERGDDGRNGTPGIQGLPGVEGIAGSPGRPGDRGEDGRNGIPGSPGAAGQCPNDCYYTQMYMQQLQAAQAQQQNKGPSAQAYSFKG